MDERKCIHDGREGVPCMHVYCLEAWDVPCCIYCRHFESCTTKCWYASMVGGERDDGRR